MPNWYDGARARYVPLFIFLALSGFILLIWNITSLEETKCPAFSTSYKTPNSSRSTFKSTKIMQPLAPKQKYCPHVGQKPTAEETLEEINILKSIAWPEPLVRGLPLNLSSDAAHSYFLIQGPAQRQLGDQLLVTVKMKNFLGQPKRHGGDLLVARLHSPELGAGVAGQVIDHHNGSYTLQFPLLWTGVVQVEVTLVHSSEAVVVLKRLREERPDRVYFMSKFSLGRRSETTECSMCLPDQRRALCNFTEPSTGEPWFCYKPRNLGCDTRINHYKGGYKKHIISQFEAQFVSRIKVPIKASGMANVNVLPAKDAKNETNNVKEPKLTTAGYYYNNSWRSLDKTVMRQFNDPASITKCLTGKNVYMFGDSTVRQWFEYLNGFVPDLQEFNLHSPPNIGPFLLVDSKHNIMVKFQCHGPPIRFNTVHSAELHYIPPELDRLKGGPQMVVLISLWSHFSSFPIEVYIRRLRHIRKAVVRLLNRAPSTLVFIRTPNLQTCTPDYSLYNSDWFGQQQNAVVHALFQGINVRLVDAWEMVLAQPQPHQLHPPRLIIKNMLDFILSNVCPVKN